MALSRPLLGAERSVTIALIGVVLYTLLVGETIMLNNGLAQPSTALLLADSGAAKSTGDAWLQSVNPRLALISVGAGNPEGNFATVVLARLAGRDVLRTDQHGAITVEMDGTQMWAGVER